MHHGVHHFFWGGGAGAGRGVAGRHVNTCTLQAQMGTYYFQNSEWGGGGILIGIISFLLPFRVYCGINNEILTL